MKIQILSDLHNEFISEIPRSTLSGKERYRLWMGKIPITDADLIVLAGDIDLGVKSLEWATEESIRINVPFIYVAGNHEYYNHEYCATLKKMRDIAEGTNVHFLENNEI